MRRALLGIALLAEASVVARAQAAPAAHTPFRISGKVVRGPADEPLSEARVAIALPSNPQALASVITGPDGRFLFPDLAPGKYVLLAQRRGFRQQTYNQHEGYSVGIAVGPGLDSEHLVFRLVADAAIAGRIVDEESDPVAEAVVRLYREDVRDGRRGVYFSTQANSDADGYFRFSHLEPGKYRLGAGARPWYAQYAAAAAGDGSGASPLDMAYPTTFYPDATEAERAETITARPGEQARADITMRAVPAIHLRLANVLSDDEGFVVEQTIFGSTEQIPMGLEVSPDNSILYAGIAPGRYVIAQGSASVTMNLEGDAQVGSENLSSGPSLSGIVELGNQPRPTRFGLALANRESGETTPAEIGQDGRFQETLPAAGTYDVSFWSTELEVGSMAARGAEVRGHTLRISGNEPVQLAVVAAQGLGRVQGLARRHGKPMAGAMVVLVPADPDGDLVLFRRDQSDSDGTFNLLNAVPGKYTVIAIADGWELEWSQPSVVARYLKLGVPVEIEAGKVARVEVAVQEK